VLPKRGVDECELGADRFHAEMVLLRRNGHMPSEIVIDDGNERESNGGTGGQRPLSAMRTPAFIAVRLSFSDPVEIPVSERKRRRNEDVIRRVS
jgi:hypothetical protein